MKQLIIAIVSLFGVSCFGQIKPNQFTTNSSPPFLTNVLGYLDVAVYGGALGNNSHDDYTNFQNTINSAQAAGKGVSIPSPSSKYLISGTLTNFKNLHIVATGTRSIINGSGIINFTGASHFMSETNSFGVLHLDGITVDGPGWPATSTGNGLNLTSVSTSDHGFIENCSFYSFKQSIFTTNVENTTIQNCGIGYGSNAIVITGIAFNDAIRNCSVGGTPTNGFIIDGGTAKLAIDGCDINANGTSLLIRNGALVNVNNVNIEHQSRTPMVQVLDSTLNFGGANRLVNTPNPSSSYAIRGSNGTITFTRAGLSTQSSSNGATFVSDDTYYSKFLQLDTLSSPALFVTNRINALAAPACQYPVEFGNSGDDAFYAVPGNCVLADVGRAWLSVYSGTYSMFTIIATNGSFMLPDLYAYPRDVGVGKVPFKNTANVWTALNTFGNTGLKMTGQNGFGTTFIMVPQGAGNNVELGNGQYTYTEFFIQSGSKPYYYLDTANNRTTVGWNADSQPSGTATFNVSGTAAIPTNTAAISTVLNPLTINTAYTSPAQRGTLTINYYLTDAIGGNAVLWWTNQTSHEVYFCTNTFSLAGTLTDNLTVSMGAGEKGYVTNNNSGGAASGIIGSSWRGW